MGLKLEKIENRKWDIPHMDDPANRGSIYRKTSYTFHVYSSKERVGNLGCFAVCSVHTWTEGATDQGFFLLFFPPAFFSPLLFLLAFFVLLFSAFSLMATHSSAYIRSGVEKRERGGTEGEKEKKRKSIAYAAKT